MLKQSEYVVTIDGPAGGGKSTAAKALASELGFDYLDTGAMYRCAALAGLRAGVDWDNPAALSDLIAGTEIRNQEGKTYLNGSDVSLEIRSEEVTRFTRYTADSPEIRRLMTDLQRSVVRGRRVVTEGRDQGSAVFPDAFCKFYLTASPETRAMRRMKERQARGETCSYHEILEAIIKRDEGDTRRAVAPLVKPEDAVEIDSDTLSSDEVVQRMAAVVREALARKTS